MKKNLKIERMGVFMWMDAGWLVGGMRVIEDLLRGVWEERSKRVQQASVIDSVVMVKTLGSEVFWPGKSIVRYSRNSSIIVPASLGKKINVNCVFLKKSVFFSLRRHGNVEAEIEPSIFRKARGLGVLPRKKDPAGTPKNRRGQFRTGGMKKTAGSTPKKEKDEV